MKEDVFGRMSDRRALEVMKAFYAGKREHWEEEVSEAISVAIEALEWAVTHRCDAEYDPEPEEVKYDPEK